MLPFYLHLSSESLEVGTYDVHAILLLICYKFREYLFSERHTRLWSVKVILLVFSQMWIDFGYKDVHKNVLSDFSIVKIGTKEDILYLKFNEFLSLKTIFVVQFEGNLI